MQLDFTSQGRHGARPHLASGLEALVPLELQEAQQQELQRQQRQGREAVVLCARLEPLGLHTQQLLQIEIQSIQASDTTRNP